MMVCSHREYIQRVKEETAKRDGEATGPLQFSKHYIPFYEVV